MGTELTGESNAKSLDMETLANWWSTLSDSELTSIIKRATEGNLDLRKAQARILEVRARRDISRADRFPTLKATGSASRSTGSKETGSGKDRELYDLGFHMGA